MGSIVKRETADSGESWIRLTDPTFARISAEQTRVSKKSLNAGRNRYRSWATRAYYWLDLWRYRELFRVLAWRDLSLRYKQMMIGVLWALILPVLGMLVFTTIFGQIERLPSDGRAPYPLIVLASILPWTFFSTGLSEASNSLIDNANLISKSFADLI